MTDIPRWDTADVLGGHVQAQDGDWVKYADAVAWVAEARGLEREGIVRDLRMQRDYYKQRFGKEPSWEEIVWAIGDPTTVQQRLTDDAAYEQGARDMLATLMTDGSLSVDCPWCFAKTDEPCRLRDGTQAYRTHSDRVKAARRAGKAATVYEQGAKDAADKHHVDQCCRICGTHVMPHRGCILR